MLCFWLFETAETRAKHLAAVDHGLERALWVVIEQAAGFRGDAVETLACILGGCIRAHLNVIRPVKTGIRLRRPAGGRLRSRL